MSHHQSRPGLDRQIIAILPPLSFLCFAVVVAVVVVVIVIVVVVVVAVVVLVVVVVIAVVVVVAVVVIFSTLFRHRNVQKWSENAGF